MSDKIEEIRAQHKASDNNFIEYESTWDIHAHRATLLAEVERLTRERDEARAEAERLRRADDLTRTALGGWVFVPPDGGAEPTHERVAAVVAEVDRQRDEIATLRGYIERMIRERDILWADLNTARRERDEMRAACRALEAKP